MTREEARKAAEVMLAYADGKEIEQAWDGQWVKNKKPKFNWGFDNYRIKSQPTYRPFKDAEECWNEMQKHQPFGWLKDKEFEGQPMYFYFVLKLVDDTFFITGGDKYNWAEGFYNCTFADGEPFGVKEDK